MPEPTGDSGQARGRGRGGRGGGGNRGGHSDKKNKKRDMGRKEWSRSSGSRRGRDDDRPDAKRQRVEGDGHGTSPRALPFTDEEIGKEERRPKRKVAVMLGYSGSGYKGMQLWVLLPLMRPPLLEFLRLMVYSNTKEKTIEGDLFAAFVASGAISKANSDDPKKSSFVRCARTDKGVHAAGNVMSLKMIVEDDDIVEKINSHLSPQIRVWGIERTNGSFSCYQLCDSRIYEYLIPTHTFLPPHPQSYLGKKLFETAKGTDDLDGYEERQREVWSFWEEADKQYIQPVLDSLDPSVRAAALSAFHSETMNTTDTASQTENGAAEPSTAADPDKAPTANPAATPVSRSTLDSAVRRIKAAYLSAKTAYRLSEARLARIRSALDLYTGTLNFHNYTSSKPFHDASAKRHIKSFTCGAPFLIHNTEWLSLKVHGQSFMMHQIRKMVGMLALVVRCGCPLARIPQSYDAVKLSIPRAPGLGLLLERPVFETYNARAVDKFNRATIDFDRYADAIEEFKQREIYARIWREEEGAQLFHSLCEHVDRLRGEQFVYLTSKGMDGVKARPVRGGGKGKVVEEGGEDEEEVAVAVDPESQSEGEGPQGKRGEGEEG
ncbi:MAG: tRNA pseudouridine synthase 1 [Piccolia ochrophora]|nr:MAG: tRNA pseudouridine synthase 1 [Piccolia ochrophora]